MGKDESEAGVVGTSERQLSKKIPIQSVLIRPINPESSLHAYANGIDDFEVGWPPPSII